MKKLICILLVAGVFGCDDEESKDLFIGKWAFEMSNPAIDATFTIKKSGNTYVLESPVYNELSCDQQSMIKPQPGKFIKTFALYNSTEKKGVGFINCRVSGNVMSVDSVAHITGPTSDPASITFYFNRTLLRIE